MTLKNYIKEIGLVLITILFLFLLDPFEIGFAFGYLIVIILLLFDRKRFFAQLDHESLFLFIFSVTYTLFNALGENKGAQYLAIQIAFPTILYVLGKILVTSKITKPQIIYLLLTIGVLFTLSAVLSVITDLLKGGFVQSDRTIANFWTGRGVISTGFSGYFIYSMTLPAILILNRKRFNMVITAILSGFYIIAMLCVFRLGSRTLIGLTAIIFIVAIFYIIKNQNLKQNLKFIVQLVVITVLILKFAPIDLEADYLSTLGHRLQNSDTSSASSAGGRTELWEKAIGNVFTKPLGWQSSHYSHNLWLDAAKVAGIIPLIFLLIFNIKNIINHIKLTKLKQGDFALKMTFILFSLASLIYFFVEPVLEGVIYTFFIFCLIQGILKGYIIREHKKITT